MIFRSRGLKLSLNKERRRIVFDPDLIERIRTIFLQEAAHVSISDATALFGWSRQRMREAGEIETIATWSGTAIAREEVMAMAVDLWSLEAIEEALGLEASTVLPEAIRTCELPASLPRYQVAMLEYFAEQRQTNVSGVLARELDDLASAHFEELSAAVHGFAEAFEWPQRDQAQRP